MRNVVFIAPYPLETTYRFVKAVASLSNVRVLGVVAEVPRGTDAGLFRDVVTVRDPMDARQLTEAGRVLMRRHGAVHRIVGILEPLQVPLALMREALDVPGTRAAVADLFRDKGRMKDELRRHGLPCARHRMVAN